MSKELDAASLTITSEQARAFLKGMSKRRRRKQKSKFEVEFVKVPVRWINRLAAADIGPATYRLALVILVESFKLDQMAISEIVLSREVTGLSKDARRRAISALVKLKLIKIRRRTRSAARVVDLYV